MFRYFKGTLTQDILSTSTWDQDDYQPDSLMDAVIWSVYRHTPPFWGTYFIHKTMHCIRNPPVILM